MTWANFTCFYNRHSNIHSRGLWANQAQCGRSQFAGYWTNVWHFPLPPPWPCAIIKPQGRYWPCFSLTDSCLPVHLKATSRLLKRILFWQPFAKMALVPLPVWTVYHSNTDWTVERGLGWWGRRVPLLTSCVIRESHLFLNLFLSLQNGEIMVLMSLD